MKTKNRTEIEEDHHQERDCSITSMMKFISILCIYFFMLYGKIYSECCNTSQDVTSKQLTGDWPISYTCCNDCTKPNGHGAGLGTPLQNFYVKHEFVDLLDGKIINREGKEDKGQFLELITLQGTLGFFALAESTGDPRPQQANSFVRVQQIPVRYELCPYS
uniref:Uncharacterized protein n=1 Tax=Romanomermis culicivorax TaxID=13658 RepID=A0A915ITP6_ROMCU